MQFCHTNPHGCINMCFSRLLLLSFPRPPQSLEPLLSEQTFIKHLSWISSEFVQFFFFFWKGSTFSDAGSDGTQPASWVDIQNCQSTYSCRCPMYGACQNDVFCGLFCSATLAIRCRSKAPFVHERLKTPNTNPQAVEPDP